ncbi:MAG TPA: hypothetical protein DCX03_04390 [Bacteroidales bacterium]|nr:hypothetical protein [Bacteroidales bacterium]
MGKVIKRIIVTSPCEYIYETASFEEVDAIIGGRVDRRKNYRIDVDSKYTMVWVLQHKQEGKKILDKSKLLTIRKAYPCKCQK